MIASSVSRAVGTTGSSSAVVPGASLSVLCCDCSAAACADREETAGIDGEGDRSKNDSSSSKPESDKAPVSDRETPDIALGGKLRDSGWMSDFPFDFLLVNV